MGHLSVRIARIGIDRLWSDRVSVGAGLSGVDRVPIGA